jgi:hypothetical protein
VEFKSDIDAKVQIYLSPPYINAEGSTLDEQNRTINSCVVLASQYKTDAARLLSMRAVSTSGIKKASVFVEKYKQINDQLRALNLEVLKMAVNLASFEQKMPCYLVKCVGK